MIPRTELSRFTVDMVKTPFVGAATDAVTESNTEPFAAADRDQ